MDLISIIVGSSTPDGLAPLSQTAVITFAIVLTVVPLLWAGANLVLLILRPLPGQSSEGEEQVLEKNEQIFIQLCRTIMKTTLDFLKYNFAVGLFAGIIFFLVILGAIQNFEESNLALAYLYGLLQSIFLGIVIAVVSQIGISRVSYAACNSLFAAHITAKNLSNFVSYFVPSLTTLLFFLILLFSQDKQPSEMKVQDIKKVGKSLMSFAFGISTAAIGTKINSVIYGKASEGALPMMNNLEPNLPRNHTNPVIICKSVGQIVRKIVSNALDYNMYLGVSLTCAVVASTSIIGADQQGQIIFGHSVSNCYLPVLAFCFLLFFSLLASGISYVVFSPDSGIQAAVIFKRQIYVIVFFLSGFLALVSYLCLPVQYFINSDLETLKSPVLAYLILLVALIAIFVLMSVSELQINHPTALSTIINSCKTGSASSLLSGLSFGYLGNALPIIFWSGLTFLSYYWLGGLGVALLSIGIAMMIPNSLGVNTYFALIETSSFITHVGQLGDQAMGNLMAISQYRRMYQIQVHSHFTSMALIANYAIVLNYVQQYGLTKIPFIDPSIYAGLFIGSMIIYAFGATVLLSIQTVTPSICLDIQAQIQEFPGILEGNHQADCARSNFILTLNSILQLKFFLPFLYVPFLLFGLVFGPKMTLGVVVGMMIAGLQLAFSSGLSGNIWNSARTQIFLGRAVNEENQAIQAQSQYGSSINVGNQVGMKLKDAIGSSIHGYISFISLTNVVMAALYSQLH